MKNSISYTVNTWNVRKKDWNPVAYSKTLLGARKLAKDYSDYKVSISKEQTIEIINPKKK